MKNFRCHSFRLFPEAFASARETMMPLAGSAPLVIPDQPCFLQMMHGLEPRLTPDPVGDSVVLEPVTLRDGQPRLLLVNPSGCHLRVNDSPAPRVSLIRERDQFQFDDSCVFHVAIFHRPQTGPAPADKIGKPCPICLAPFTEDPNAICYQCPCGTVLHLQDPTGLECARAVHDCPTCRQVISVQEGYSWLPEIDL